MEIPYVFDSICPWCGKKNEVNRGVGHDEPPKPGDVSICFECTQPGIYEAMDGAEVTMRKPSGQELDALSNDPNVIAAIFALMSMKASRDD